MEPEIDLGSLTLPELIDLMRKIADEIELRAMQEAGEA